MAASKQVMKGSTRVAGVFGDPVTYTLSPRMHNAAFAKLGLDLVYVPFRVTPDQLPGAIQAIRDLNLAGVNITIPHKQAVAPLLDRLSPGAGRIGAVNTIVNRHGRLEGHNTDAPGFLAALKEETGFDPHGKKCVLFGAGGAGLAISFALAESGASSIVVLNRTASNAEALARRLKEHYPALSVVVGEQSARSLRDALDGAALLANATPDGPDVDFSLASDLVVADAVYAKATPLILEARGAGLACMDGFSMLAHQGALAFELFTGAKAPLSVMKKTLVKR